MVPDEGFLVLGVATEETSGFRRFHNSAALHGLPLHVLGSGEKWRGGGFRLSLLRAELEKYKDEQDKIVLVADAYDVLFNAGSQDILANFKNTKANILFASDTFCWPEKSLAVE